MIRINLLPPQYVWRRLVRRRFRQWAAVFAIATFMFGVCNLSLGIQWLRCQDTFQKSNAAAEPVRMLQLERLELAKKANLNEKNLNQLRASADNDRTVATLGVIAQGVLATDRSVQIQELQVSLSNPTDKRGYLVSLHGIAAQADAINAFMESLNRSGMFPSVELRSTQERLIEDKPIQEFMLECFCND